MIELVSAIIFFTSLIALGVILYWKIPLLLEMPEVALSPFNWQQFFSKIKRLAPFRNFSPETFLQKILSKIRILTLRTDSKTSGWLQKLREKEQKKKFGENDNYWKEIKKKIK